MANPVLMPKAGISVESCIIGTWQKKVGDPVSEGDILFDYETDKASFECESTADGTLLEIFFESGDEVPCLTAVCAVGNPGEDCSKFRPSAAAPAAMPAKEAPISTAPQAKPAPAAAPDVTGRTAAGISPRARKLAERLKTDPAEAVPTGPQGRIIARDIEALAQADKTGTGIGGRSFDEQPADSMADAVPAVSDYTDEKLTKIRTRIASAMQHSLAEAAQLTHQHSFDASALLAYRKVLKNAAEESGLMQVSLGDMVMFAVSRTLKKHPDLNAHLVNGNTLRRFSGVHLGMAVDTPRGLLVPTIFHADQMSLLELSQEAKRLAEMARSGSISPDLLQGGTFTVSNLGSLGVEMFTPIINPPQTAILGVCSITDKIRTEEGTIRSYPSMGLSLTYDHRIIDGAPASRFARELCQNLETFTLLLAQ